MSHFKTSILLLLLCSSVFKNAIADPNLPIRIPTGGNSYITAGPKSGAKINHYAPTSGLNAGIYCISSWNNVNTIISTYVKINAPGTLNVGIRARGQNVNPITLTVNGQSFTQAIPSSITYIDQMFGSVTITNPGYVKIDIQGAILTGSIIKDVADILIGGDATTIAAPNFAATPSSTPGAGFYWVRRGSSLNLSYSKPSGNHQWMYHEVTIPAGYDPPGTYYMSNGFSGGYMGIQVNSPTSRRVLFSVWNPSDMSNGGTVQVGIGAGVNGGSFTGEGEGTNVIYPYMWITGNTYGFLTKIVPDGLGNTLYSAWFYAPEVGQWKYLATFRRPNTNSYVASPGSFLEGFDPENGHLTSKAYYSNMWYKESATNGSWVPSSSATFIPDGIAKGNNRQDYQGGIENGSLFMKHNGFFNDFGPNVNTNFTLPAVAAPIIDLEALEELALPVSFGNISTEINAETLLVNWTSLNEYHNHRFEVEASKDGTKFIKIGSIASKAINGFSSTPISYSYEVDSTKTLSMLGGLYGIALLGIGFLKRKNKICTLLLIAGIAAVSFAACTKSEYRHPSEGTKIFIRLKQVDIDGKSAYSKVVQIANTTN